MKAPPLTAELRIARAFARARAERRLAIAVYLTVGYPDPAATPALLRAAVDGGADLVELGVPFSDPLADGTTVQRAERVRSLDKVSPPSRHNGYAVLTDAATAHDEPRGLGRSTVLHETLTRPWQCASCGKTVRRGEMVRVTITPGAGANRVEHDHACR